jgi:hypothetical protein
MEKQEIEKGQVAEESGSDSDSVYVCPTSGPRVTKRFGFCDLLPG